MTMTRRELLASGTLGAFSGAEQAPSGDPRVLREIETRLDAIGDQLALMNGGSFTGRSEVADKLREAMVLFLRGSQKYPDYIEVGHGVYHAMYDWHIRNRQPLTVGRGADGRYGLVFMFTRLLLRPDVVADFISVPYDQRA
jgi:hypothetical protein